MSNVIVDKQKIDLLANAIADKSGVPVTMTLDEMKEAVDGIDTSGIVPTGNINITHSGQTDVTNYATVTVPSAEPFIDATSGFSTVSGVRKWSFTPNMSAGLLQGKDAGWAEGFYEGNEDLYNAVPANTTVTPTESAQTVGGYKYMMEGAVTVNAIPSSYVGSSVTQRSSSDMTASGATVTAPAGYYASSASKTIPNAVIGSGLYIGTGARLSVSTSNGQLIMAKDDNDGSFLVNVDSDGYIAQGQRAASTCSVQLRANCNINDSSSMTVSGATVTAPAGYYAFAASKAVASGTEGTPTATKGTVSNHAVTVTPSVTNSAGYIMGGTKTGTGVSVSASELVSGTYTVSASGTHDVTNYASASVPAGTAGTPSASKGAVSNHSVSVTPSVTNSTGWITGSTKTGTAVSVSASELVSGNLSITENTTTTPIDVTNYATVTVNVQGGAGNVWQDENGRIHLDSEGPGDSYATGTITPVERVDSISFDTGLSGTVHGVMVVPTSESPWKSNGRTLGAFYSFNPGTQFITYFTWSSNASGASGSNPQYGNDILGYTQSGSVVTVTSPNVS